MPDNFDLFETDDAELTAMMVDLESFDEASWLDEADPWVLDEGFDE